MIVSPLSSSARSGELQDDERVMGEVKTNEAIDGTCCHEPGYIQEKFRPSCQARPKQCGLTGGTRHSRSSPGRAGAVPKAMGHKTV
nr:unnamed protein product [Callosobruchus analis]